MKISLSLTSAALVAVCAASMPAMAHEQYYSAVLSGQNENPVNASQGGGAAVVTVDLDLFTLRIQTTFAGLSGNVTASHIHCCTTAPGNVGVAVHSPSLDGFPTGGRFGSYDHTFDMTLSTSYNSTFLTNNGGTPSTAFSALLAGLDAGRSYLNIHSSFAPGGEIRGFLTPVPEPETYALFLSGLAVVGWVARRRKSA